MADGDRLQQVFLNLLLNAKDAMPEGGSLDIRSFVDGSGVTVEVSDTGRGIDDGDAVRIFDPFFTTKPAGKGSGLGLSVCYGIVTSHGGRIHASRRTGGGTTFAVTLPLGRDADQDPGTRS
jgi:signal transduction histidine kinase